MKILYLIHQFYPEWYTGTEKFVLGLAGMMQRNGHKVKVVTYSFYGHSFYDRNEGNILYKDYAYKGIPVTAFTYTKNHDKTLLEALDTGFINQDLKKVARYIIKNEQPDVVHVGHPMRVGELVRAAITLNIPYVLTLTDFWLLCPKVILSPTNGFLCAGPEGGEACRKFCPEFNLEFVSQRLGLAKNILSKAGSVISPSKFLGNVFKKEFGDLNVRVINHGIAQRHLEPNRSVYMQSGRLTFLYAGSLSPHKGVHIIIEAFNKIAAENISFKIYGSSSDKGYCNSLARMAKANPRIELCGVFPENDIGKIFSNVDVVVVPSLWYENYPLVLHEALASHVPVIASGIGGMAEKIKHGFNGLTFPMGDVAGLAEAIQSIVSNPAILNDMKINIRQSPIPTIEQEAYAYERIYRQTINLQETQNCS